MSGPELTGVLIGLDGELGAGKTTFAQGFVAALAEPGQAPYVTSPTFAILHRYATVPPVAHLDLYRLGSLEELEMIGYRDIYYGPGVILVEWMARVPEAIPREWLEIHLARERSDVREIRVRVHGPRLDRIVRKVL